VRHGAEPVGDAEIGSTRCRTGSRDGDRRSGWAVDFAELTDSPLYRIWTACIRTAVIIEKALAARETKPVQSRSDDLLLRPDEHVFRGPGLGNPKARRGYSRDQRPDCKQVVVGLAVGKEVSLWPTRSTRAIPKTRQTLPSMLDSLEKRVGVIKGMTVW